MVARRAYDLRLSGYRRRLPTPYGDFQVGGGGPCGQIDDLILLPHPRQEIIDSLSAYYRGKQARKTHFYLEWIEGGMYVNTIVFLLDRMEEARDYVAVAVEARRKADAQQEAWGTATLEETLAEERQPSLHPVPADTLRRWEQEAEAESPAGPGEDAAPQGGIGRARLDAGKLRAIEEAKAPAEQPPPEWMRPSRLPDGVNQRPPEPPSSPDDRRVP
jgi:hypothetical protein